MLRRAVTRRWLVTVVILVAVAGFAVGLAWWSRGAPPPAGLGATPSIAGSFDATSPDGSWVVAAGEGSFAGYRAREMLTIDVAEVGVPNEAVGRTTATSGSLQISDGRLTSASITADLGQLRSDLEMRDGHLAEAFDLRAHPATFSLSEPAEIGQVTIGRVVDIDVRGDLAINGVTRPVTFPLQARWNGPSIQVAGGIAVKRSDFDLETGQFFFFRVAEEFTLEVELTFVRACGRDPCAPGEQPPRIAGGPSPSPSLGPVVTGRPAGGGGSLLFVGTNQGPQLGMVETRHLYRVDADGTGLAQVTIGTGEFDPTVSADGRIAFGRATDTAIELWLRQPDGAESLVTAGDLIRFDFAPDGRTLVAVEAEGTIDTNPTRDLVTVDLASGVVTRLTSDGRHKDSPDWAPDGSRIAFGLLANGANGDDIYVIERGNGEARRLTDDPDYDYAPDWSPDGTRLLFARPDGLVIRDLGSGSETVLSTGPANAPAWSPDGTRIAFESGGDIWIVNADGSGARRLDLPFDVESNPTWLAPSP